MYSCEFEGDFGELEKVDDLTYKTTIINIVYKNEADYLYFYLPGSKVEKIPFERK